MSKYEIDFVVTWVDGNDPAWRQEKAKYSGAGNWDDSEERYRDWELLQYWFRGVEQFAPWVRKIHFVTWGHLPEWLDTTNPKLHIVRHEEYIPKEYLPVFNSTVLEIYMHRIEGLAEHFVYFNDDVFLTRPVQPEDFFREGKPCDMLAFQPVVANPKNPTMSHLFLNNTLVLAKYFDKRKEVKAHLKNYLKIGYPPLYFFYNMLELAFPLYTGFYNVHGPAAFTRTTFEELWEKEEEILKETSQSRFRSASDISIYLFRDWQKLSNHFFAKNIQRDFQYFNIEDDNRKLIKTIRKQKKKVICINDAKVTGDVEGIKVELQRAFGEIEPGKSTFEK